jgi:hypothetical protein
MTSDEEYQKRIQELRDKNFKKLYFIHIPKAAGSYVREFPIQIGCHGNHEQFHTNPPIIKPRGEKPCPVRLLKEGQTVSGYRKVGNIDKSSLKFATVRNPFDYLMSCYFSGMVGAPHQIIKCNKDHSNYKTYCNHCNGFGYEKFLFDFSRDQILYEQSRKNLFHQIFDESGNCCVDVVIRSERVAEGLRLLADIALGISEIDNVPKNRVNASDRRNKMGYKKFYTDETRAIIENKVKKELEIFGYKFDGPIDDRPLVFLEKGKSYDIF